MTSFSGVFLPYPDITNIWYEADGDDAELSLMWVDDVFASLLSLYVSRRVNVTQPAALF